MLDNQAHLCRFGMAVADATREYFEHNDGSPLFLICGIDILTTTAIAWLSLATNESPENIEEYLQERIRVACGIAFTEVKKTIN